MYSVILKGGIGSGRHKGIPASKIYKLVHRESGKILAEGNKKSIVSMNKAKNAEHGSGTHFVGMGSPSSTVGQYWSNTHTPDGVKKDDTGGSTSDLSVWRGDFPGKKQAEQSQKRKKPKTCLKEENDMSLLESLTARLATQKAEKELQLLSPLERMGMVLKADIVASNTCNEVVLVQKDWAAWNAKEKAGGNNWEHKQVIHEYGAKVRGLGSPTQAFNHYVGNSAGDLKKVTPNQFRSAQLPDKTSDSTKEKHVQHRASQIKQFNHKVDFNTWTKAAPRSHDEKHAKLDTYGVK